LSNSNPYIEDTDDYLANLGQFQIVLVFLASMVLLVKRMPEQDGAPGNLFKGPLFACVLVTIGLMSLLATACTLIIGASPRPRARTQSSAPTRRDVSRRASRRADALEQDWHKSANNESGRDE
jgi:hypothetical protein